MPKRPVPSALERCPLSGGLAAACDDAARALGMRQPDADFALRPRDPRQDLQYGESLLLVADPAPYRKARLVAARARAAWPREPGAWLLSGAIEACLARPEAALRLLDKAVSLRPASGWARAWRGVARATLSRRRRREDGLREALADFDKAFDLGVADAFARPWAAELRHDLDDREGALADLARLPADAGSALWARVERGEILCECGRLDEAMREFTALTAEFPRDAWAWALRGRTLATSGRAAEGLPDLDRAARLAPRSAAVRAWRSEALRRLGRYKDARADLDRAVKLDPRFTLAWVWRGRLKLLAGKPAEALRDLDRAVRLDPRYRLGVAWRGEALLKLGQARRAAKDLAAVAPMDPRRFWNEPAQEGVVPGPEQRAAACERDFAAAGVSL